MEYIGKLSLKEGERGRDYKVSKQEVVNEVGLERQAELGLLRVKEVPLL